VSDCWNCGSPQPEQHRFCARCGQRLAPSRQERERLDQAVDYLMREVTRWRWLSPEQLRALQTDYAAKRQRLAGPREGGVRPFPGPATASPPAPTRPQTQHASATPQPPQSTSSPQDRTHPSPSFRVLSAFLEETNIRWLLVLGGLLLASAGVGLLYSHWSAHGRSLVALALLATPVLCLTGSWTLRSSLPLSSRILALLGGVLLPTSLVAARLFELGGLNTPWPAWNLNVFLFSSVVLLAMALARGDVACLYLGSFDLVAAACALAAWSGRPSSFGLACLAMASLGLVGSRAGARRLAPFKEHLFGLSQALAGLGLLSTLPAFTEPSGAPPLADLSLLVLGAAFFVAGALLTGSRWGILSSAPVAMAALLLHVLRSGAPTIHLGYGLVVLGGLYTAGAGIMQGRPGQQAPARAARFVGTTLIGIPLALVLAGQAALGLADNFSSTPTSDLHSAALIAVGAALLYGAAAFTTPAPRLLYACSAALAHAWFLGWVLWQRQVPGNPELAIAFLPLLAGLALAAHRLDSMAREPFAVPVARLALAIAVSLAARQLEPGQSHTGPAWLPLGLYSLAFSVLAWLFKTWTWQGASAAHLLAHLAALGLAATVWVGGGYGELPSYTGLLVYAVAAWGLAGVGALPGPARLALSRVSLAVGPVITLAGPQVAGQNAVLQSLLADLPALLWLTRAQASRRPGLMVATSALLAAAGATVQWLNGQPHLGHSPPGLLAVLILTIAYALRGYQGRPWTSLVPAWLFAAATWDGAGHLLEVPADERTWLWTAFWLLVCAAVAEGRHRSPQASRILEFCAGASTCALIGRAALASGPTFLGVGLVVAAVLSVSGWRRPQTTWFAWGWTLLALAPIQAELQVLDDGPLPGRAATLMALLAAAATALERRADGPQRLSVAAALPALARATALGAGILALIEPDPVWSLAGLACTTLALWLRAAVTGSRSDWHLGFVAAYAAYGTELDRRALDTTELWTTPPALWMLLWGERYRAGGSVHPARWLAVIGVGLLLVPPFLATVTGAAIGHAVFLVAASLTLLLAGLGRRHRIHALGASLALLSEVALQALQLAARIPWWYIALAAGLLLVGLGILFEKRRATLMRVGQHLMQEVARW